MSYTLYIAGYTGLLSQLSFSPSSSTLSLVATSEEVGTSPSWLSVFGGKVSVSDESELGLVTVLDGVRKVEQDNAGEGAVSSAVTPDGRVLAVANYNAASVDLFDVTEGLEKKQTFEFKLGKVGPVASRQEQSHPHQAIFDPSGTILMVPDLGMDQIHIFSRRANDSFSQLPSLVLPPGSGPRHVAFPSNSTERFYSVEELTNTVTLWNYTTSPFSATPLQKLSTLSPDSPLSVPLENQGPEGNKASEIILSPDNQFLYVGNRAGSTTHNDSIAIFYLHPQGRPQGPPQGEMMFLALVSSGGRNLRQFALTGDGKYLVCANQDSGLVTVLPRNERSGFLGKVLATWESEQVAVAVWA